MLRRNNLVNLPPEQQKKTGYIKVMSRRFIRFEIFFREPKEPYRWVHPASILWVRWPLVLLLQMHEATRGLDQSLEIIRVLRFRAQPEMLEDVVRFIVALLIPTAKKAQVAGMFRDLVARLSRRLAAQVLDKPGNSLAFIHGELSFGSAVMTGNRARILFPTEGCCAYGRG
jgi:hypothetical protein